MKMFSTNKRRMLLIGGCINLVILSIVAIVLMGPLSGTQAQRAWGGQEATLTDNQNAFSAICYALWLKGEHQLGIDCLRRSEKITSLLQGKMSADSFASWPEQNSLSDLANQGKLTNPHTQAPIKTEQDLTDAISQADHLIGAFLKNNHDLLDALWTYKAPAPANPTPTPMVTSTPGPATSLTSPLPSGSCTITSNSNNKSNTYNDGIGFAPGSTPDNDAAYTTPTATASSNACSVLGANCAVNAANFQHADAWPTAGPQLLQAMNQKLQDQNGQQIEIYELYGRLLLQNQCSVASLAQTLKLNGQPITQFDQAVQWERNTLVSVALNNSSNNDLVTALIWAVVQSDNTQVDNWFSSAVLSNPVTPPATASATPTASPTPGSQPPLPPLGITTLP